jgi:hypothetical protein
VTHGDHEAAGGEHVQLAELDRLGVVDVARRTKYAEQRLAVALELGALMGLHGVLDRPLMEVELPRDGGELFLAREVQGDPRHPVAVFARDGHAGHIGRLGHPSANAVYGSIDDHVRSHDGGALSWGVAPVTTLAAPKTRDRRPYESPGCAGIAQAFSFQVDAARPLDTSTL